LWARGLTAKDIHKEILFVCRRKCLTRDAVNTWAEKGGKGFVNEEFETEVLK
jgi:hypothetical protein